MGTLMFYCPLPSLSPSCPTRYVLSGYHSPKFISQVSTFYSPCCFYLYRKHLFMSRIIPIARRGQSMRTRQNTRLRLLLELPHTTTLLPPPPLISLSTWSQDPSLFGTRYRFASDPIPSFLLCGKNMVCISGRIILLLNGHSDPRRHV